MKFHFKVFMFLFLNAFIFSINAADETGYEVELIIVEDKNARYIQSEEWAYNDMLNNTTVKVDESNLEKQQPVDPEYKQLPWEGAKLSAQLKRLLNNNNYRVLAFKRWKQTGLDRVKAFSFSINDIVEPHITADDDSTSLPKPQTELVIDENTPEPESTPYLTGDIKLIMSRYLHFNVNLLYIRPTKNQNNDIENKVFPVINERRMRSREIHYIDHPLVGIIVLATPYKISKEEINEDSLQTKDYKTI